LAGWLFGFVEVNNLPYPSTILFFDQAQLRTSDILIANQNNHL